MEEDLRWITISIPLIKYEELKEKAHKYDELMAEEERLNRDKIMDWVTD